MALAKGNISYLLEIAAKGIDEAIRTDDALASGVNLYQGQITNQGLAESLELPFTDLKVK